ncbi:MAG: hypothetical protein K2X27_27735, partial [Candidatus Obscuribacterales bacterium]|nr:hypothetical protein [Candidatus Obscuribacterales bacterium]
MAKNKSKVRRLTSALSLIFLAQTTVPLMGYAQQANVDLSSTTASVTVKPTGGTADISVGNSTVSVGPGSVLTPAQYAAYMQVIHTGHQSLVLGNQGNAVGGTINLSGAWTSNVGNLNVPTGVTAVSNFGVTGTQLNLNNLTNSGNIYAVSNNPAVNNAVINASNIYNNQGALLTTVLPAGGLTGITGAINNLSLTLNVLHDVVNAGTISSAANLNINAGGSIINQLPAGVSGLSPLMQAMGNLNLNSQLGNILNSGTMSAITGNVNIASLNNLLVNNLGGTIQALSGQINVRDILFSDKKTLDLKDGDWLSKELNIFNGTGAVSAELGNVTGLVNASAGSLGLTSTSQNLNIGSLSVSGDPIVGNLLGDLTISGSINTSGNPLVLYARNNITSASSLIQTGGGSLYIIAGGAAANVGGNFIVKDCGGCGGGNISLGTSVLTSGNAVGAGGDVAIIALGGQTNAGTISMGSAQVASTSGSNPAGNITIIADADPGNVNGRVSLTVGDVFANGFGGAAGSGVVTIATAHPTLSSSNPVLAACQPCIGFSGNIFQTASASPPLPGTATDGTLLANSAITVGAVKEMSIVQTGRALGAGGVNITAGNEYLNSFVGIPAISTTNSNALVPSGNVNINVKSATPFQIGTVTGTNGIVGTIVTSSSTAANQGSISINNTGTGGIQVNNAGNLNVANGGAVGSVTGGITLNAGTGVLTLNSAGGALGVAGNPGGSDAGTISLTAARIVSVGNFQLNANGTGSGKGGSVSINSTGAGNAVTVGGNSGELAVNVSSAAATNGDAGSVSISSAGALTVDPTKINFTPGTSGKGGTLSLSTTGVLSNLQVNGNINVDGTGSGNGGTVTINSGATADVTLQAGPVTNGVQGTISANAAAGGGGNGGSITINSAAGLSMNTGLSANGDGAGSGGTISLAASGPSTLLISNPLSVTANAGTSGNGGNISISVPNGGFLNAALNPYNLNAGAAGNGAGGTFSATYAKLTGTTFSVTANGAGTGSGGSVSFTSTGPGVNGNFGGGFNISAIGGASGSGGTVVLKSAGDLTVAMANVDASAGAGGNGNGATYDFSAGTGGNQGNLLVNALNAASGITANGVGTGSGGTVRLSSNSTNTFLLLGGTNGVLSAGSAAITANGGATGGSAGTVVVNNDGSGGIEVNNNSGRISLVASNGAGGKLTLTAANGAVNLANVAGNASYNLNAGGAGNNAGGSFTVSAQRINLPGGNLAISANGTGSGGGGSISITQTGFTGSMRIGGGNGLLNLSAVSGPSGGAGGTLNVSTSGDLVVDMANALAQPVAGVGAGGNYTFRAGTLIPGTLTINGSIIANGVGASSSAGNITLSSTNDMLVLGNLSANGQTTGNGGSISLTAGSTSVFAINSAVQPAMGVFGTVMAGGAAGGSLSITNPGGISILNNLNDITVTSTLGSGGNVSLTATHGLVSLSVVPSSVLNLNAGGAGSFGGGNFTLNAMNLVLVGASSLTINANASTDGNGGTTTINLTAPDSSINIGSAAGQIEVTAYGGATSGDGGKVNLTAGSNITVNSAALSVSPQGTNGGGATYNFSAGTKAAGDVVVNGNLDATGRGTGKGGAVTLSGTNVLVNGNIDASGGSGTAGMLDASGGNITLNSNSLNPFTVAAGALLNGVTGTIKNAGGTVSGNEGSLTIKNDGFGGIVFDPNQRIHGVTQGAGGAVSLTADSGSISFSSTGTLNTSGAGSVGGQAGRTPGGNVTLSALGIESLGHLSIVTNGSDGKGGDVTINAKGSTSFLQFAGSGNGSFNITANGGALGGNAGKLNLTSGLRMQVDPTSLVANAGPGSTGTLITLNVTGQAGQCCGSLFITSGLNLVNAVTSYAINVNSATPFVIGGTVTGGNGINGNIDMHGSNSQSPGNFSITQSGTGGIVLAPNASINLSAKTESANGPGFAVSGGGALTIDAGGGTLTLSNNTLDTGTDYYAFSGGPVTIKAGTIVTSAGTSAPVTISAIGGAGASGGSVTIKTSSSAYNMVIGNAAGNFNIDATGGQKGGSISLESAGNLTVAPTSLLFGITSLTNGDGGSLSLKAANNLFVSGSLSANGIGIGDGGSITLASGSVNPFAIFAGAANNGVSGTLSFSPGSTGGSGGQLDISSKGFLQISGNTTFNANASGTAGTGGAFNGGSIKLVAPYVGVAVPGVLNLTANAAGNGNGGLIDVSTTQAQILNIGGVGANITMTATGGSLASVQGNGGTLKAASAAGITIRDMTAFNAGPLGSNGKGANLTLVADGAILTNTGISANGAGAGDGGVVAVTASQKAGTVFIGTGSLNSGINGNITADAGGTNGKGGSVTVNVGSAALLLLNGPLFTANGSGFAGDGGSVSVSGQNVNYVNAGTTLSANGSTNGKGGSVSFVVTGSPLTVGTAANQVNLSATGGSAQSKVGDGGQVTVSGLSLVVNPAGLNFGPLGLGGNGGSLTLNSGQTLQVNGSLAANAGTSAGNGGSISITANSAGLPLSINGVAGTNNIAGNLSANSGAVAGNGGSISINNTGAGSGITLGAAAALSVNASGAFGSKAGSITLTSANGAINFLGAGPLTVQGSGLADGGSISVTGTTINTPAGSAFVFNADGGVNGGSINLVSTGPNNTPVKVGTTAGSIQASARGGATVVLSYYPAGNGGSVAISTGLSMTVSNNGVLVGASSVSGNGGSIKLSAGNIPANQQGLLFVNT